MHRYGWRPDLPDQRDHLYEAPCGLETLPARVDLTALMPPVYDQGELGSCTGNATAAALQFERMKQALAGAERIPSRLFIYYCERQLEHTIDYDSGAQIRDGIKSVAKKGACFESGDAAWPYDIDKFAVKPPQSCWDAAKLDRAVGYKRLDHRDLDQLRSCLADGYPFEFGFTVYESFESDEVARTGVVPMPGRHESVLGGHAVLCGGYDDASQRFIVRNSWGSGWGQSGYFTIPYAYLTDANLADDFWTIRLVAAS